MDSFPRRVFFQIEFDSHKNIIKQIYNNFISSNGNVLINQLNKAINQSHFYR